VIAASLSHWRAPAAQQLPPAAQLLDALRVLQIMANGLQQGRVSTFPELSKSLQLGYDVLEKILEKLASADMVCKADGQGWLMMRDASRIRATELLRLFVLDRGSLPAGQNNDPLQQWLAQSADVTLQELFARKPA